jgi:chromosome condensin MukBEF MukE localization factor
VEEKLIKKLMSSMKCEECGQNYEAYNVDVLGQREDMWFLRVHCTTCQTQCLVAAVVKEEKALEEASDLAGAEIEHAETVATNDVLDMHNFLTDFDGDFSRLFGQGKPG